MNPVRTWQYAVPAGVSPLGYRGWLVTIHEGEQTRRYAYDETEGVESAHEASMEALLTHDANRDPESPQQPRHVGIEISEISIFVIADISPN